MLAGFALLIAMAAGCGGDGLRLADLPVYPNATETSAMGRSGPAAMPGAELVQYTTTDGYEGVVDFYADALARHHPDVLSHTSELGRQTAFSIRRKTGMISVAVQEFTEEGTVNITFMALGG